jgi:hypothetical protein
MDSNISTQWAAIEKAVDGVTILAALTCMYGFANVFSF